MAESHYTKREDEGRAARDEDDAARLHHLATADPEPERDGAMTGPAHEEKYGLERAADSAAAWRSVGVHPTENRALAPDEDGGENLRGRAVETAEARLQNKQTTAAARASDNKQ